MRQQARHPLAENRTWLTITNSAEEAGYSAHRRSIP
jgi:hypothetical protein